MSVPTEPGLYWVRLDGEWTVVELHADRQKAPAGQTWTEALGVDYGQLVPDDCWGPKLEPPDRLQDLEERLACAESELCRLTHHKRGDGCSIPDCRNYRPVSP